VATTVPIPLTALTAGQDLASPAEPIGSFTSFVFSIARNAGATPLRTLSGPAIEMHVEYSRDGGATWPTSDSQTINGGIILDRGGAEILTTAWESNFPAGITHTRARVHVVQAVTVQGSLVLSP
jgi:hypothetical protein